MRTKCYLVTLLLLLFIIIPVVRVKAADTKEVSVTLRYDYAFEVLKIANTERESGGAGALSMDKSLLDTAMLRAAEIVVSFNHIRPNGESCFTANSRMFGENIAWGQKSSEEVMKSWMNSSGHRGNIMNKSYKSTGVGCVEYGGRLYWVQCFGFDDAESVTQPKNAKAKYRVALSKSAESKLLSSEEISDKVEVKTEQQTEQTTEEKIKVTDVPGYLESCKPKKISGFKAVPGKKKITFKWKKNHKVTGYQLKISENKNYSSYMLYTLSNDYKQITIKKMMRKRLKSKKKYYAKIRSFVSRSDGTAYSKWTKKTVKTK